MREKDLETPEIKKEGGDQKAEAVERSTEEVRNDTNAEGGMTEEQEKNTSDDRETRIADITTEILRENTLPPKEPEWQDPRDPELLKDRNELKASAMRKQGGLFQMFFNRVDAGGIRRKEEARITQLIEETVRRRAISEAEATKLVYASSEFRVEPVGDKSIEREVMFETKFPNSIRLLENGDYQEATKDFQERLIGIKNDEKRAVLELGFQNTLNKKFDTLAQTSTTDEIREIINTEGIHTIGIKNIAKIPIIAMEFPEVQQYFMDYIFAQLEASSNVKKAENMMQNLIDRKLFSEESAYVFFRYKKVRDYLERLKRRVEKGSEASEAKLQIIEEWRASVTGRGVSKNGHNE